MILNVLRFSSSPSGTLGVLMVDGEFESYTIEDPYQYQKVPGDTRISAGIYDITLRTEGGMNRKYSERYGEMHAGMLWLQEVPGFEWIYIHTGNVARDSRGCILVGDHANNNSVDLARVNASRTAYTRIYPGIAEAILAGDDVRIRISDLA